MKSHVKLYLDSFGYTTSDFIFCECCNNKAVDIHHIEPRGMGGDPKGNKDVIENLMALCRKCHIDFGDVPSFKPVLKDIHLKQMALAGLNCTNASNKN